MRSASKKKSADKYSLNIEKNPADIRRSIPLADIENAGLFEFMFDALEDAISAHSLNGDILYANSRMLEILGRSRSEVVGSRCADVFHDSPCPHEEVIATSDRMKVAHTSLRGKAGFDLTVSPLKNYQGKVIGFVRVVQDATINERAQEELLKAEHFATLGQMVAGIAHDVGTPLNIISGYSEYLLMQLDSEGRGRKELTTIIQQTRRIADFIKQMLDLARPVQGRNDAIELKGFLADSLELLGSHLRKLNVKASAESNTGSSVIYGDGARLRQAFFNIINNAAQDLGPGSEMRITIDEQSAHPETVQVIMSGRNAEGKEYDFSKAFSSLVSREWQGEVAGMGLLLTKEILSDIGARMDMVAQGEDGIAFVLSIPKCKSEQ